MSRVSEEEEEDYDYSPDEDEWRKVNKVISFVSFLLTKPYCYVYTNTHSFNMLAGKGAKIF